MLDQRMPMAFIPDTDCLPEGVSIPYSVVAVKSDAANKTNVLVFKETSNNMQLYKKCRNNQVNITIGGKKKYLP